MQRTTLFATTLALLGGALCATPDAIAQQPATVDEAAATPAPVQDAPVAPTASTTIISVPDAATPPGTTTSATIIAPAPGATDPAAPATVANADGVIDPATYQKRTEFDNTPWRFNMEQNGKRMTADEFTAWMEARGVRVAKGPKPHVPASRTGDGMPAPGSAAPSGVAQTVTLAAATPAPAAASGGLQPGSVTPTDAWTGTEASPASTTSATTVAPAVEAVPLPADAGTK